MTEIRSLTAGDIPAVHRLNQSARPAVGDLTEDRLRSIVGLSSIALTAEVDGDVAGFCLVLGPGVAYDSVNYRWFDRRHADFVYLDRVVVHPDHRSRGLGERLYDEVERLAVERHPGADAFTLEVNLRPRNEPSLRFHRRLGFREVGRQETPYGALVSLMERPLPGGGPSRAGSAEA